MNKHFIDYLKTTSMAENKVDEHSDSSKTSHITNTGIMGDNNKHNVFNNTTNNSKTEQPKIIGSGTKFEDISIEPKNQDSIILNNKKHMDKFKKEEFSILADKYSSSENKYDYAKAVALYEYTKKLNSISGLSKEKEYEIEAKIQRLEDLLVKIKDIQNISESKQELTSFRLKIEERLNIIKDLGFESDPNIRKQNLMNRAIEIHKICIDIREFFIGKNSLIKHLIDDNIKKLGGLPKIKNANRDVVYSIFVMGSMASATMTPWSDLEFGILIEEKLSETEEKEVKEFFRNLTLLLQINIIRFGETILPSLAIKELNDFQSEDKIKDNWFYDSITSRGFSYDGQMPHACKTPLGRKGYINFQDYELIATPNDMIKYQKEEWFLSDWQLSQGLECVLTIHGSEELTNNYLSLVKDEIKSVKQIKAEKLLWHDLDTYKMLPDFQVEEGRLYDIKKEIYRLPDRLIAILRNYYDIDSTSHWDTIKKLEQYKHVDNIFAQKLFIALSISLELRLRTYYNHQAAKEDFSAIILLEQEILAKEISSPILEEKVFYFKNINILYEFYYIILPIQEYIVNFLTSNFHNKKESKILNLKEINFDNELFITGIIHKRFLKYDKAIISLEEFLITNSNNIRALSLLFMLYVKTDNLKKALEINTKLISITPSENVKSLALLHIENGIRLGKIVGKAEESLKELYIGLETLSTKFPLENIYIAAAYYNISKVLSCSMDQNIIIEALEKLQLGLEIMEQTEYKGPDDDISVFYDLKGKLLCRLYDFDEVNRFDEAIINYKKSLNINLERYRTELHPNIADLYNTIAVALSKNNKDEEALIYFKQSLEIWKKWPLEQGRIEEATLHNNIGKISNNKEIALKHFYQAEKILENKKDPNVALIKYNIAKILEQTGEKEKAINKYKEIIVIAKNAYYNTAPRI